MNFLHPDFLVGQISWGARFPGVPDFLQGDFLMPGDPFYKTSKWQDLARFMNKNWEARKLPCSWCGEPIRKKDRTIVDHIRPRHTHPGLQWSITNLQVLHHRCNTLKGIADRKEITPTGSNGFPEGWE